MIEYIKGKGFYGTLTKRFYESELAARHYETLQAGANRRAKADAGQSTLEEIGEIFASSEPDYVPCPENVAALEQWFKERGVQVEPSTFLSNLRMAFASLRDQGKLVLRGPLEQRTETDLEKLSTENLRELTEEYFSRQALRTGDA